MADVEPREIKWLWPGRVPMGRITLLVGRPGEGKSFVTCDMASRISTGTPWPDGSDCPTGSVVFISAEDDPADTIRPRLDAHSADVRKVHLLSAVRRTGEDGQPYEVLFTLADVAALESALKSLPDCRLIVVDPIGSFLGGDTDAHRDNEVRGVLAPVAKLAEKYGPAVMVVAHRRKSAGSNADDLALGSRAFTGIARAVWHLSRDNENKARRLLLPGKNNLAPEGNGLAFAIVGEPAAVAWERDPVTMSADDALAVENGSGGDDHKPGPEPEAQNQAADWLSGELADQQEHPVKELKEAAKGAGLAWRTVQKASQRLGVKVHRASFGGGCVWRLADNTVRRICGRARQYFRAAIRRELVQRNPFDGIKCAVGANPDRLYFVTRQDAEKVLAACPDAEWRLIFALSRYAGMRCPSEHLALRWGDVDWANNRMTVRSPKTEHYEGKASRLVPIFPELLPHLRDAFEEAEPGTEYVITRCRDGAVNLRTQLERIVRRAGLQPWPKLFHNLRATRETELAETFPLHVVCAWIGNSSAIAAKHYLQVTNEHFDRAIASGKPTEEKAAQKAAQNPTQQPHAASRKTSHDEKQKTKNPANCGAFQDTAVGRDNPNKHLIPPRGVEPLFAD